jgi:DNA-binding beta-propeller fold protein YncE
MPGTAGDSLPIHQIVETSAGINGAGSAQLATASGTIGEYNTLGATVHSELVSGLSGPSGPTAGTDMAGIAVSGDGKDLFVANIATGTIGEYTTSGGMVNPALVTGLSHPMGIALEGDNLFVVNRLKGAGTIGEYTIMNGTVTAMKPSLVSTGLHDPIGIAVEGANLFVVNHTGTIGEFTTSGGTGISINTKKAGLHNLEGIAVGGGDLFVVDRKGMIGEYNATTGAKVALFNTGLKSPIGIAFDHAVPGDQGQLFVVDKASSTIDEYNATTGMPIMTPLVMGLNGPTGIAIFTTSTSVPDASSTWTLLLFGLAGMFGLKPLLHRPA